MSTFSRPRSAGRRPVTRLGAIHGGDHSEQPIGLRAPGDVALALRYRTCAHGGIAGRGAITRDQLGGGDRDRFAPRGGNRAIQAAGGVRRRRRMSSPAFVACAVGRGQTQRASDPQGSEARRLVTNGSD